MKTIRELIGYEGDAWERLILMEVVRRHPRPVDVKEVADALLTDSGVVVELSRGMAKDRNGRPASLVIDSNGLGLLGGSEWVGALGHPGADITKELALALETLDKLGLNADGSNKDDLLEKPAEKAAPAPKAKKAAPTPKAKRARKEKED